MGFQGFVKDLQGFWIGMAKTRKKKRPINIEE